MPTWKHFNHVVQALACKSNRRLSQRPEPSDGRDLREKAEDLEHPDPLHSCDTLCTQPFSDTVSAGSPCSYVADECLCDTSSAKIYCANRGLTTLPERLADTVSHLKIRAM